MSEVPLDPAQEIARLRTLLSEREAALIAREADLKKAHQREAKLAEKVKSLEHQLGLLKRQLFGKKSEKVDPRQLEIAFKQACDAADAVDPPLQDEPFPAELLDQLSQTDRDELPKRRSGRRSRGLKIPPDLQVVQDAEIHPPAEELVCDCGCEKVRMGEEVSRRLELVPARFYWREQVRVKYLCPSCATITRPSLPPAPIEKGLAGPSLLAELLINKYSDHLPLDRLTRIFSRDSVELAKSTLCSWVSASTGLLEPIAEAVHRAVLSRPVVQTDETGILVLDPEHPEGRFKGRMWVYCGERGELGYEFSPTKESRWPKQHLVGFRGTLQADAYGGFDTIYASGEVLEAGCSAHARRKFKEAHDAEPERAEPKWALLAYQRLFEVEREARERGLDAPARHALRQERSAPLAAEFYAWLEQLQPRLVPSDPLRRAVQYALNHREALTRFLQDGRLEIDNNRSERSLRQVAVGRKNYLFAGSVEGAKWAAIAYTLIMSCNELGVPIREYLIDVLERVSTHPAARVDELTPRGWLAARELAPAPPSA